MTCTQTHANKRRSFKITFTNFKAGTLGLAHMHMHIYSNKNALIGADACIHVFTKMLACSLAYSRPNTDSYMHSNTRGHMPTRANIHDTFNRCMQVCSHPNPTTRYLSWLFYIHTHPRTHIEYIRAQTRTHIHTTVHTCIQAMTGPTGTR
jgi:hypothetical protein